MVISMSEHGAVIVGMKDPRASTRNLSRFNAIKHGLTAKTPVLPGEDPVALQAKIDAYKAKYQTRDEVEGDLMELAAITCWQVKRANRIEAHRVARDIVMRAEADALRAGNEVADLGRRLLFDRRGPWQLYPSPEYLQGQPRTSDSGEAHDPDQPVEVKRGLEATPEGCGWLLGRWFELRKPLENESEYGSGWISCQKFMAIRLLGKQPLDAMHDPEVAMVFLASHALLPTFGTAFQELQCEIREDRVELHEGELYREEWEAITPADSAAGRAALLAIVDREIERLLKLEAERAAVADFLEEVQSNLPSDGEIKTLAQIQRHSASAHRLVLRNIDTIERARRSEAEGWGKARRERERLRALARRGIMLDERFVLDERGTVRDAQGYDGDLAAGLARWKAENGAQPCERYPEHFGLKSRRGWAVGEQSIEGGGRKTEDGGRRTDGGGRMAADGVELERGSQGSIESKTGDGKASGVVAVSLVGQGPATKIQNEIEGAGRNDQGGCGEGGNADGTGAAEAGGLVPLSLVGQGPATKIQNEIAGAGGNDQDVRGADGNEDGTGAAEARGLVPVGVVGQGPATKIQNEIAGAGGNDQDVRGAGGNEDATGAAEAGGLIPVSFVGQGTATKIQNEIGGGGGSDCERRVGGGGETRGRRGGEAKDPRRTGEETCGQGDGGDRSGARDSRRTVAHADGGEASGGGAPLGSEGKTCGHGRGGDGSGDDDSPSEATRRANCSLVSLSASGCSAMPGATPFAASGAGSTFPVNVPHENSS